MQLQSQNRCPIKTIKSNTSVLLSKMYSPPYPPELESKTFYFLTTNRSPNQIKPNSSLSSTKTLNSFFSISTLVIKTLRTTHNKANVKSPLILAFNLTSTSKFKFNLSLRFPFFPFAGPLPDLSRLVCLFRLGLRHILGPLL